MVGDKDNQEEEVKEILNNWSSRLEYQRKISQKKLAIETCKDNQDLTEDVAEILIDAHNTEKVMIKGKFKTDIRNLIIGALQAVKDNKNNLEKQIQRTLKENADKKV
jgi:hypothetical protein